MALSYYSLITYGIEVTDANNTLDFEAISGVPSAAILRTGFYSPTSIVQEVERAMNAAAASGGPFTCEIDRSILGGRENRITISNISAIDDYLRLNFQTGPNIAASVATTIGFLEQDYTGASSYSGSNTCGTALIPEFFGYNFAGPDQQAKLFGAVNIAASGLKEATVFNIQHFIDVEFKYEPKSKLQEWVSFRNWSIQQRPFDFTPLINVPDTVYNVTLEKTSYDGKGLGLLMKEMLPNFPNLYQTGPLNLRIIE